MTFDDDFIRIGMVNATCKSLGLEWPPPEFINVTPANMLFKRVRLSNITDEQRAQMKHVARGAEYRRADVESLQ